MEWCALAESCGQVYIQHVSCFRAHPPGSLTGRPDGTRTRRIENSPTGRNVAVGAWMSFVGDPPESKSGAVVNLWWSADSGRFLGRNAVYPKGIVVRLPELTGETVLVRRASLPTSPGGSNLIRQ